MININALTYRIMRYCFDLTSCVMDKHSLESKHINCHRSDILLAQNECAQRLSLSAQITTLEELDQQYLFLSPNQNIAKQIYDEPYVDAQPLCSPSCSPKSTLNDNEINNYYENIFKITSSNKLALEKVHLDLNITNGTCTFSNNPKPLSYTRIKSSANYICIAEDSGVFSLHLPIESPCSFIEKAQRFSDVLFSSTVRMQPKDISETDIAVPSYMISQVLNQLLLKIASSNKYQQFCATKLQGFSVIDDPSLLYGNSCKGQLFDGYGSQIITETITDKMFNTKRPVGIINLTASKQQVPGRSIMMINDIPFGLPGWVNLHIQKQAYGSISPKLKIISASNVMPLDQFDRATVIALIENLDSKQSSCELRRLVFSITDFLKHAQADDYYNYY